MSKKAFDKIAEGLSEALEYAKGIKLVDIKRAVSDNKFVMFKYYRDGALWYETEYGEVFSVPIEDIGNATFNRVEKAILLMRYMRIFNASLQVDNPPMSGREPSEL